MALIAAPPADTGPRLHPIGMQELPPPPLAAIVVVFLSTIGLQMALPLLWYVQIALAPMVMVAYLLMGPAERRVLPRLQIEPMLAIVVVYVAMSVLWSHAEQPVVVNAFITLVVPVGLAHLCAGLYDGERLLHGLAIAAAAMTSLVLIDAIARPAAAFSSGPGDSTLVDLGLRSFFYQKNSLGAALVMVLVLRVAIPDRRLRVAHTVLTVIVLALSKSSTSWLSAMAVVSTQIVASKVAQERRAGRRGSPFVWSGAVVLVVVSFAAAKDHILRMLGKGEDLTGRDVIWVYAWRATKEHLWFGYGKSGFWTVPLGPVADVRHAAGWMVGSAHQGLIETILSYGVVGAVLVATLMIVIVVRIVGLVLRGDDSPVVLCSAGIMVGLFVTTLSESGIEEPGFMFMALASGLLMARQRRLGLHAPAGPAGVAQA